MRNKGEEQLYGRLSRKELQCLCKKYGLPANRSSSEMAKSLASFVEKNLSSISSGQRLGGIQEVSLPAYSIHGVQPGAPFDSFQDSREDTRGLDSCLEEGNRRKYSQSSRNNELDHCTADKTYNEEGLGCSTCYFQETSNSQFISQSGGVDFSNEVSPTTILCKHYSGIARDKRMEEMCPIQDANVTDVNFDSCLQENAFPSSVETLKAPSTSSFEFYVRSEEGINLCVDLSSSPSDWIQKLKSEVNICENMSQNKSSSFHQELGRFGESSKQIKNSFLWNIDIQQAKDGNVQSGSSPSALIKGNKDAVLDHPDGGDGFLTSIAVPSSIAVVEPDHYQEDQGLNCSEPNSDARDGSCTDENGCTTTLDSDVVNTPGKKLSSNSVLNASDCQISLDTLKHQNSKLSNEICEYSTLENSCSIANSQVAIAGSSAGGSMEMLVLEAETEQKDASSMPCKNGEFLDLVDSVDNTETEQSALANSSEPDINIGRKHMPTPAEEWEGNKTVVVGGESSECSQLDDSIGKTCLRLDNLGSTEVHQKKRPSIDSEDRNYLVKPDTKVLRSTTRLAGKALPRRSTRLVSK